jgi:hypothetical protein
VTRKRPSTELCPRPYGQRLTHENPQLWGHWTLAAGNHRVHARLTSDSIQEPLTDEELTRFYAG